MSPEQSIRWKNACFPIDDVTYLNFAAHAAIRRVALNAVQSSGAAQMRPQIVDGLSFFSIAATSSLKAQALSSCNLTPQTYIAGGVRGRRMNE